MRYFCFNFRNASGGTSLTSEHGGTSASDALKHTTPFVRANLLGTYEVDNPAVRAGERSPYYVFPCY